jgi:hypothetical protein
MFDVRRFGPRLYCFFLFVIFSSILLAGQESEREKESEKQSRKSTGDKVTIKGSVHCTKPDTFYSIDVPDRPGHSLIIAQRKCTWTEPLVIQGAKTKEGVWTTFTERMEGTLHIHSFEVDTLDNGEKTTMQTMGQILGEKGPLDTKGQWSFMRGTGKLKGIRGGGTYEGKLDADDVLNLKLEGVYEPAAMAGSKN